MNENEALFETAYQMGKAVARINAANYARWGWCLPENMIKMALCASMWHAPQIFARMNQQRFNSAPGSSRFFC